MEEAEFNVEIKRLEGYDFRVSFKGGEEKLLMSEPEPLGRKEYPNGGHVMGAAIGHCMCSGLIFCLEREGVNIGPVKAEVTVKMERNEQDKLRISLVHAKLFPQVEDLESAKDCIESFEEYCIVTQSVRQGIEVKSEVTPSEM